MLNFRKITLEDKPLLDTFLKNSKEVSCENTFVNLFIWQSAYGNQIAIKNDTLFIKYEKDGNVNFRLPMGGNFEEGLKEIISYHGAYPTFWSPINENFSKLPKWFSERYDITPTRDGFDYIYLQDNLANLSGKKYHSKRNHISTFTKNHDWKYEEITEANSKKVKDCARKWYRDNADRLDEYALCEKDGLEIVLDNITRLSVTGGAILIEGEVVAFALGTPINQNVFDIFAEKALTEFSGAYAVINNEFAKRLEDFKYINREDDMGLEGLRKAKLSYKPTVILEKYSFKPKGQL